MFVLVVPLERAPELPACAPNRGLDALGPAPGPQRLGPHVAAVVAAHLVGPQLNGFLEELPFRDAEPASRPLQLVERGFFQACRKDLLHT